VATFSFSLSDDDRRFVETKLGSGDFASVADYFAHLVQEDRRRAEAALNELLAEGLEGPMTPMTRDDWDGIRSRGYEALGRRRPAP
jgi:Arc/MetJ-type ribon-helix-helix transcriptional regulator